MTTNLPPETLNDIAKVLTDFGFHVTVSGLVQTIAAIFILARLLRKAVPDNWQSGTLGTLLKHSALEVNPNQPKVSVTSTTTTETTKP